MLFLAYVALAAAPAFASEALESAVSRGAVVFQSHCALCHGADARGGGRAAHLYNPRPADLTRGEHDDRYREIIIRKGGAAVGRSAAMPAWGLALTPRQLRDLLTYVRTLRPVRATSPVAAQAERSAPP